MDGSTRQNSLTIVDTITHDIRFPTSATLLGSDAMNPAPDYSAAYVVLVTERPGLEGHGLTFTIGRGNELCVAAIEALKPLVVGRTLESITADLAGFWRTSYFDVRKDLRGRYPKHHWPEDPLAATPTRRTKHKGEA